MKSLGTIIFLFNLTLFLPLTAQVKPGEGEALHHSYVYFQDSLCSGAQFYTLRIYDSEQAVREEKVLRIQKMRLPGMQLSGLDWGKTYYWQYTVKFGGDKSRKLPIHHFSIREPLYQSFDTIALNVRTNQKDKNAGGWIAIDYTRSVYDREGNRIWTLPMIPGLVEERTHIRDLKFTKENTVTFLTIPVPLEIDLQGKVLWQAPYPFLYEQDSVLYHHELQKTSRGTYLVLADRKVWRRVPGAFAPEDLKTEFDVKVVNGEVYKKVLMALVLEFNREGKLLWSWDANRYVKEEDLNYKKTKRGFPNLATHANALRESPDGKKIYVGFRDLSRIVKIDKQSGKVETSYGEKYPSGEADLGNGLFLNQHDAFLTSHGSLLLFNNNGALAPMGVSSIIELRDPCGPKDSLLLWRFDLNFDTLSNGKSMNGGSVAELPNHNILLCGGSLNRIFEVTRDKKVVWDVFLSARGKGDAQWQPMPQYRCHFTKEWKESHYILEVRSLKNKGLQSTYDVILHNTGQLSTVQSLEFLNAEGKVIKDLRCSPVKPGESLVMKGQLTLPESAMSIRLR